MKKWISYGIITLILASIVHFVILFSLPGLICSFSQKIIIQRAGGVNRIIHESPTTAENNPIVNSSPDLLYSSCAFDVSDKPLYIIATIPETYWSVSGYASNTDNFFVVNNEKSGRSNMSLILKNKTSTYRGKHADTIITAPDNKGVIIFRLLVRLPGDMKMMRSIQQQATCSLIE